MEGLMKFVDRRLFIRRELWIVFSLGRYLSTVVHGLWSIFPFYLLPCVIRRFFYRPLSVFTLCPTPFTVRFFLLFTLSFLLIIPAHSAQVTLQWDSNTEPDLAGYKIYYGNASKSYQLGVDVGNRTTSTISNLEEGKIYYFAATAYDTLNNESEFSNELVYNVSPSCTYSISPTAKLFGSVGGGRAVIVYASPGCNWTATSNTSWLIITSNSGGTGNGAVYYFVSDNAGTSSRTATLTIAGRTFTVTQSGIP